MFEGAKSWVAKVIASGGKPREHFVPPRWKPESRIEIISGAVSASSAPEPEIAHLDEIEMIDPEIWARAVDSAGPPPPPEPGPPEPPRPPRHRPVS